MNIKINNEYFKKIRGFTLVLVLVSPFTLTACGKKVECEVNESHAHMYRSNLGYIRYIEDEHLRYDGCDRCEQYINIEGKEDLYKFIKKKDLIRIDDNLELIKQT